ncbi:O-methyltransferase-domain-containing protein [Rhexocercosporidium sp. MPI-PUGE-AT-0058]|nr:O-methyltransferase-domain-containing protein [Rhexocercosporidium sp. MPI-PUGE-AT-0058]
MSRLAGAPSGPPGFPAFEPALSALSSLSSAIQTSLTEYENAKTPKEKSTALQKIQASSTKLSRTTTPIQQQFMQINFGPNVNVAIRIGVEMGLFNALPPSGEPSTVADLSQKTNAEEEFLFRIARTLSVFDILQETDSPSSDLPFYSHTPYSRFLTLPPAEASTRHLFDNMLQAQVNSASGYYLKYGYKNPEDAKNSPFSYANGRDDMGLFDILEKQPERMKLFNSAMAIQATIGLKEVMLSYPFDKLEANKDGVVLVDVGGGKGQVINEILTAYPELKGSMVLEDMQVVLEGGPVVPEEVQKQPYDFFKDEQPIKASNYFMKSILHDWPDISCLQILKNLAPAMRGSPNSRLLICELVLPDRNPTIGHVLRDMNMLVIAGKERNKIQWQKLLGQAGFKILGYYGLESANSSIIEAVLDE